MSLPVVGIISPGHMGTAIGRMLRDHGIRVLTCLDGRSELTRLRALEAGFGEAPGYDRLVTEIDLLLSVVVPSEAVSVAKLVAGSLRRTGARPVYADCNAISPQTVAEIARVITEAGSSFIDAGVIGPPPSERGDTRLYCSGPDCSALEAMGKFGLDIRVVGPLAGQASGLKMVYAASTKGTTALWTELLVAAKALGLDEALANEFSMSRSDISRRLMDGIPSMPRRSRRWVGEMEEIAATFEGLGLTPLMLQGAAAMFRLVGETALADQTSRQPDPSLEAVLEALKDHLR
ncbi:MAG: DUF1932 domain-containing protein [Dehalococcoidia bacterium]|nr:DUF1932 domain-containing protein [Dehalococcoidia bacterium]